MTAPPKQFHRAAGSCLQNYSICSVGDASDHSLGRCDIAAFAVLARWVAAIIDDQAQVLRSDTGEFERPRRRAANSGELLMIVEVIDENV
jgi:hypothetical protein